MIGFKTVAAAVQEWNDKFQSRPTDAVSLLNRFSISFKFFEHGRHRPGPSVPNQYTAYVYAGIPNFEMWKSSNTEEYRTFANKYVTQHI